MFIGIVLMAVAFIWIAFDWKKSNGKEKEIESKKNDLNDVISEAEQMIVEINKLSGYVVSTLESKTDEIFKKLDEAEERAKKIISGINSDTTVNYVGSGKENKANYENSDSNADYSNNAGINNSNWDNMLHQNEKNDTAVNNLEFDGKDSLNYQAQQKEIGQDIKSLFTINTKSKEVLKLAEQGLSSMEIAKKLNIGIGEIQLILDINK